MEEARNTVSRISQAKKAFHQKRSILTAENTCLQVRKHLIKTYTWSILLYGSEA
jgi:hypothetical protein